MRVTLSSSQPFLCHGLKKAWHFSDTVGAEDPSIQEERESFWTSIPMESVLDCAWLTSTCVCLLWHHVALDSYKLTHGCAGGPLLFSEVMMSL
jgi:hypothetical protein